MWESERHVFGSQLAGKSSTIVVRTHVDAGSMTALHRRPGLLLELLPFYWRLTSRLGKTSFLPPHGSVCKQFDLARIGCHTW